MSNAAWLIPALPLASFVLLALFGLRRVRPIAPIVSIAAIGAAFIISLIVLGDLLTNGETDAEWVWLAVGNVEFHIGYIIDPISVMMLVLVTSVSLGVQVYSLEYMKGDPRFGWYFAAHSLFAASMLGLVLTSSLLLLYITWELVGLCSFLLIGFWYERRSAAEAAKKAFITTRLGDVGLLIGIIVLYLNTGTFEIRGIFAQLPELSGTLVAVAAFLLFLGAMGKSAQVPFHIWLPDAMEGPTPVSALIHAATMVAAGVFLIARLFDIFLAAPTVLWIVAITGTVTAILAGLQALSEIDFKRILAYSTVSQLGLMVLALGAAGLAHDPDSREPAGGLFHLLSHGYFKALLFLTAGIALHGIHASAATIHQVRGLGSKAPLTAVALIIGGLALAGLPPLSGFFSKEGILAAPLEMETPAGILLLIAALFASFLSALYMTRLLLVVVQGRAEGDAEHLHDPPLAMAIPVLVLTLLAAGVGLALSFFWDINTFLAGESHGFHMNYSLATVSTATAVAGIGLGWILYNGRATAPSSVYRLLGPFPRWAERRFFFDDMAQWIIEHVALAAGRIIAFGDRRFINDVAVDGTGLMPVVAGRVLRVLQTGYIYNYALAFTLGAIVLAAVALLT